MKLYRFHTSTTGGDVLVNTAEISEIVGMTAQGTQTNIIMTNGNKYLLDEPLDRIVMEVQHAA
jgi:hypothetical protein